MTSHPPSQRQIFLAGEGDAWYQRNQQISPQNINQYNASDPLLDLLEGLPLPDGINTFVLEVGCGQGLRLQQLQQQRGWSIAGLDPSAAAIGALSEESGIKAIVGTADLLPFPDQSVDLLIYGFCLYLCDRNDLFRIASEAHRVLKPNSWLAILDFWAPSLRINPYHHKDGVYSYKADLPAMFTWHPAYVITDHLLRHHGSRDYTDNPNEWVAATLLRRSDSLLAAA